MNITKMFLVTGVSMILAAGLVACDKEHPAETMGESIEQTAEKAGDKMDETSKKIGEQSDKAGDVLSDTAITAKVKTAILAEPGLSVLQINVDTVDGVVTLSGSSDAQKNSDRAKEIAGAVVGVKAVENQLMVKPAQ